MTENWTQDDYEEYEHQCRLIDDAYGHGLPMESVERIAADIVNKRKK